MGNRFVPRIGLLMGIVLFIFSGCQQYSSQANLFNSWPDSFGNSGVLPVRNITSSTAEPLLAHIQPPESEASGHVRTVPEDQITGIPASEVTGAILTPNTLKSQLLLRNLPNTGDFTRVVVLNSTPYKNADKKVFTYGAPGVLNLNLDTDMILRLTSANLVHDLGQVGMTSSWNSDFIRSLPSVFPNARFVLVSLNENLADHEQELAAMSLEQNLAGKTLILAVTPGIKPANSHVAEFEGRFATDVIRHFDVDKFDELPVLNSVPVKVLGEILKSSGAKHAQNLTIGEDSLQTLFLQGEPVDSGARSVYLVSFGDIMLGRFVRELMETNSLDYPFEKMDANYLRVNDILLANLEGPVTGKAVRTTTGMSFGFFPDVPGLLKKHFFDVLSQANNHTFDKGQAAYDESLKLLREAGLIAFGNPKEITDDTVAKLSVQGQKIAFIGQEEVFHKIDDDKTVQLIKDLTAEGYKVIPFPHWGIEYQNEPNKRQQELAHKLIDAGATMIIGAHPHVPQSFENDNGHAIFYSLGNGIFDQYWSKETQEGLSIAVEISDKTVTVYLLPIKLDRSRFRLMNDDETKKFLEKFAGFGEHTDEEKQAILDGKITLAANL